MPRLLSFSTALSNDFLLLYTPLFGYSQLVVSILTRSFCSLWVIIDTAPMPYGLITWVIFKGVGVGNTPLMFWEKLPTKGEAVQLFKTIVMSRML